MTDINDTGKLTPEKAVSIIREIVQYGDIIPTEHCQKRMNERHFDMQDIEVILKNGNVFEEPEFDEDYESWKYKVEGRSIEGDRGIVVTAIISHRELLCITIMG